LHYLSPKVPKTGAHRNQAITETFNYISMQMPDDPLAGKDQIVTKEGSESMAQSARYNRPRRSRHRLGTIVARLE
jgi:hypothetical protein